MKKTYHKIKRLFQATKKDLLSGRSGYTPRHQTTSILKNINKALGNEWSSFMQIVYPISVWLIVTAAYAAILFVIIGIPLALVW